MEGNLSLLATLSTCCREKLALWIIAVTTTSGYVFIKFDFPGCPALITTLRLTD